jgi:hypothetical protein
MYDVNPLGPMMHLKELEQRAASRLRRLQPTKQNSYSLAAISVSMIAVLRRLHMFHMLGTRRRAVH